MIEIALFLGLCFFGWGDCPEPVEDEEYVLLIDDFAFMGYDWEVTYYELRQGIIGEIVENTITFASGNKYQLTELEQELEAGQIVTIRMNHYDSTCELGMVSLNNATTWYNVREKDNIDYIDEDKFITHKELDKIYDWFGWEEFLYWKFSIIDRNPRDPCTGYEKYFLESIDAKLTEVSMEKIS